MNKKLLSGIMSGVMLAGSCSAVGAEAPKGIKNSVVNFVNNHKIAISGGVIGATAIGGTIAWLVLHNRDIKVDYNVYKKFDFRLVEAVKSFKNSLTVDHVSVSDAKSIRDVVANALAQESTKAEKEAKEDEKSKKVVLNASENVEGIKDLTDDVEGTLVLKKVAKEDKSVEVTFEFKKLVKKEEKKDEVKAEENKDSKTAEVKKEEAKSEVNKDEVKKEDEKKDEVKAEENKEEEKKDENETDKQ